jgi:DNA mismatch endonuclease (patch repair protein)
MVDKLDRERRSHNMRQIRSKHMLPELAVRKLVHAMGFRYRLHRRDLPGSPDIVLPAHRKAIFVHGCFWHQHRQCGEGRVPKSRQSYWRPKLEGNVARDLRNKRKLRRLGWRTLTIWECEMHDGDKVVRKLKDFLSR